MLLLFTYIVLIGSAVPIGMVLAKNKLWARLLPVTVFSLFAYITLIIGSVSVFFGGIKVGGGVNLFSWGYVFLLLVVVALTYIILLGALPFRRAPHETQSSLDVTTCKQFSYFALLMWLIALSIVAVYISKYGTPLLFKMLRVDAGDLIAIRTEQTVEIPWHRYYWGFHWLPTFATLLLFFRWINGDDSRGKWIFLISLAFAMLLSVSFLRKSYLIELIIVLSFGFIMCRWNRLGISSIAKMMVAAVVAAWLLYLPYFHDRGVLYFFTTIPESLFKRVATAYSESSAAVFVMIEGPNDYFLGQTFSNPGGLFPHNPVNLSGIIFDLFYPNNLGGGNKPAGSLAEAYVNFGWLGVFLFFFVIFYILITIQYLYRLANKDSFTAAIISMLLLEVYRLHQNSLLNSILSPMLWIVIGFIGFTWIAFNSLQHLSGKR